MTKSTPASAAHAICSSNIARAARSAPRLVDVEVGVADVAREQRVRLARDAPGELERLAVERLEQILLADQPQLLAVRVVGERLDDVRAGVHELAVQLLDDLGLLEDDLGHVRPAWR